ncbi:MAG: hypothetical protein DSY37_04880 [Hyperthermus sp.]|nr:MAG: hypothetical protein DSY37_04880 [Hyperthermus sp.]
MSARLTALTCIAAFIIALASIALMAYGSIVAKNKINPMAAGYCTAMPDDKVLVCNLEVILDKSVNVKGVRLNIGDRSVTIAVKNASGARLASTLAIQEASNTSYNIFVGIEALEGAKLSGYRATYEVEAVKIRDIWRLFPKPVRKTYTLNKTLNHIEISVPELLGEAGYAMIAASGSGELEVEAYSAKGALVAKRTFILSPGEAPIVSLATARLKEKPTPAVKLIANYHGNGTATLNMGLYNMAPLRIDLIIEGGRYIPVYLPVLAYPVAFK